MTGLVIVGIAALVIFAGGLLLGVSGIISLSVISRNRRNWTPPQFREPADRWPEYPELEEGEEETLQDTPSWPDSGYRI